MLLDPDPGGGFNSETALRRTEHGAKVQVKAKAKSKVPNNIQHVNDFDIYIYTYIHGVAFVIAVAIIISDSGSNMGAVRALVSTGSLFIFGGGNTPVEPRFFHASFYEIMQMNAFGPVASVS